MTIPAVCNQLSGFARRLIVGRGRARWQPINRAARLALLGGACLAAQDTWGQGLSQLKQLSVEDLMDIRVTSVSRSEVALADAPSALQVLTGTEIAQSGATSIPEALRLATNLNVAQKNAHDWGISARGFNTDLANKLLVMIDGRTVYTPLFSGVRWDAQDYLLEDIDRIEVVSGPGGSVWGANAVNGVINVTSKAASATQGLYAEAGGGSQLQSFGALRYGGAISPNVHYRIYSKYTRRESEGTAANTDAGDATAIGQSGFRVDAVTGTDANLTVQGDYYLGHEGMPGARDSKISGGNLLSRYTQTLATGDDLRVQLYYDRTYLHQPFAASAFGAAGFFSENLTTYDLDFQYSVKPGDQHAFIWGLGYRFMEDDTTPSPSLGFVPPDPNQELVSGFLQDQITLRKGLILTLGTKVEHNVYTGLELEPSVRIQKSVAETNTIWAAVSRAVRTPSRIDRDIREPSSGATILSGGADFKSENVLAYEAGYRAQFAKSLAGSVSVFYNQYKNIRSLNTTPVTVLPFFFGNDVAGETHGVELTGKYELNPHWLFNAGYTLLLSHLHVRAGGKDLNNALNETSDPRNQFSVGSSYITEKGIAFNTTFRWVSTLYNNNNGVVGTVPSYGELDARLSYPLTKNMELSLVGHNLLDRQHPEFGPPALSRVEIRREVIGKIVWRY